ncbi:MAG TPA: hypothetical protein VE078_07185 [Thermoanaerobaculia bacterium]|nr:hypothetical protein [Thermoanaerobaculia bacterium]
MLGINFASKVTKWEVTTKAVEINDAELSHLTAVRQELQALLPEVMELGNELIAIDAQRQEKARSLEEKLARGEALNARLRAGVRAQYGYKSEKLTEFQLRPFRRRTRGASAKTKTPKAPAPDPSAAA